MYKIIQEDEKFYLVIDNKKIVAQKPGLRNEFTESGIFITNTETDDYKMNYYDIANAEINKLPDNIVILINTNEIEYLENSNLKNCPFHLMNG